MVSAVHLPMLILYANSSSVASLQKQHKDAFRWPPTPKGESMKRKFWTGSFLLAVASSALLLAQSPLVDIGQRHGNLRAAQQSIVAAYQRIDDAQRDDNEHLGGHAQRAKELLVQADQELRLEVNVANGNDR